jgi:sugar-specific transcriptional regulator TrmB
MAVNLDIKQNLKLLGLNESEIRVYSQLISKELSSMTQLSKSTGIPRTNIYRICEELVKKNLARWTVDQRGKKIEIVNIRTLDRIIHKKELELEKTKSAVGNLQSLFKATSKNLPLTELRYYKGKEGMKQLIWNTLQAKNEIMGYSVYNRREIIGSKFDEKYVVEFRKRKLADNVIANTPTLPAIKKALKGVHQQTPKNVKIIEDKDFYISGDTYIYNNIYAVNFWNEDEIIGVEIENPEIVKVQKSIFNSLWKIATPLKDIL